MLKQSKEIVSLTVMKCTKGSAKDWHHLSSKAFFSLHCLCIAACNKYETVKSCNIWR
jgi:hypothetical protein